MRKNTVWVIGTLLCLLLLLIIAPIPVVPFQPVLHDGTGDHNLIDRKIKSSAEADAIEAILKTYGDPHFRLGKKIFVPIRLARQEDLRWNYTTKAGLGVWLPEPHSETITNPLKALITRDPLEIEQLSDLIQDIVQESSQTLIPGEKTNDHIQQNLLKELWDIPIACSDTSITVDVNFGDPIYHIGSTITDGRIVAIQVEQTPICWH